MKRWYAFDGVDIPKWVTEEQANLFCSLLNSYIPSQYGRKGTRYHVLNRFQGGMYFHLLNPPMVTYKVREVVC